MLSDQLGLKVIIPGWKILNPCEKPLLSAVAIFSKTYYEGEMHKTPLVLIPGLLSDKTAWGYQAKHLSDIADATIISFHNEDTPDKMVQAILDQSPSQFALAGHSMGGWLALEVMRYAPERVAKLCLLNTTARPDSPDKLERRKQMIQMAKKGECFELAMQMSNALVFQESVKKEVQEMFLRRAPLRLICDQKAMIQRGDCFSILPTIQVPTLIIHARQDQVFTLEMHEEMKNLIPNAKLAIVEDSGHMSPMEQPETVTRLMRHWLLG